MVFFYYFFWSLPAYALVLACARLRRARGTSLGVSSPLLGVGE